MKFKDYPIGLVFKFGRTEIDSIFLPTCTRYDNDKMLSWIKINEDNEAIMVGGVRNMCMSVRDPDGKNRLERYHGTLYLPESDLWTWINSDNERILFNRNYVLNLCMGFMAAFTEEERAQLVMQSHSYTVPAGYTRQHGDQITLESQIWLPTVEYLDRNIRNATRPELSRLFHRWAMYITSSTEGNKIKTWSINGFGLSFPDARMMFAPVIKLDPDTDIDFNNDIIKIEPEGTRFNLMEMLNYKGA